MSPKTNLTLYDLQVILNGVEHLVIIIAVVIVIAHIFKRKNLIPKKFEIFIALLVGLWILAVVFQYVISTYNYVHVIRPYQEVLQSQPQGL